MSRGHLTQLGPHAIPFEDFEHVDANPFFAANATIVPELERFMDALRKSGDSCGARVTAIAQPRSSSAAARHTARVPAPSVTR